MVGFLTYMFVLAHVWAEVCMWRPEADTGFLTGSPHYSLRRVPELNPEHVGVASLAQQLASGSPVSNPQLLGLQETNTPASRFSGFWDLNSSPHTCMVHYQRTTLQRKAIFFYHVSFSNESQAGLYGLPPWSFLAHPLSKAVFLRVTH